MAYPDFIFQDAIPAQQMMAHAQAINEGKRIAELGKARQQEGMYRMADLELRRRQQQESNELQRMIANSQISQAEIANTFRKSENEQRAALTREGHENTLKGLKIQYPEGRVNPQEAAMKLKLDYDRELGRVENEKEDRLAQSLETSLKSLDNQIDSETSIHQKAPEKLEGWYDRMGVSDYLGSKGMGTSRAELDSFAKETKQYRSGQVPTSAKLVELSNAKKSILDQLQQLGWVYDPSTKKIVRPAIGASGMQRQQQAPPTAPGAASLFGNPGGMIELSPWQKATLGIQPGEPIVQNGVTYQVR